MPNLHVLKSNKLTRVFLISLGVVAASITCINPASADTVSVDVNETTTYLDFQVYSSSERYYIRAFGNDPVIQLYRGTSRAGFDDWNTTVSGDFLASDDDSGGQIPGAATGLDAYLSGTLSSGLDNYVIRVTSYQNWRGLNQPTQSYTLSYTGFSSGTVASQTTSTQTHTSIPYTGVSIYDEVTVDPRISTRQTTNLSFSKAFDGSDKLSDQDGQLRKTIDSINAKWGNLIK